MPTLVKTAPAPAPAAPKKGGADLPRLVGWQGFTVRVPNTWDLTGFSGANESGYLRVDDGNGEQGLEIKWATEPRKAKTPPDVTVRRDSYFSALRKTARKKRITLETKETDAPRAVLRPERGAAGFSWVGDRKAVGVVWHCTACRRTVIAQVLGDRSGKNGLSAVAAGVLGTLRCHPEDPEWRVWALYDLQTEVPSDYKLVGQQLMNVYLRLQFARGTSRLSVEQWALANIARHGDYLDEWLRGNTKGLMREARYVVDEGEAHGHAALLLSGGPALGVPMLHAAREALHLRRPATRFGAVAWHCEETNKIFSIQGFRTRRQEDPVEAMVGRTRCHEDRG